MASKKWKTLLILFISTSAFIMILILSNYNKIYGIHENVLLSIVLLYGLFEIGLLLSFIWLDNININKKVIQFLNKEGVQIFIKLLWGLILIGFIYIQLINIYVGHLLSGICTGIVSIILKKENGLLK